MNKSAKVVLGSGFRVTASRTNADDVLRMLVTGGPPVRGGGGMPQRIIVSSRPSPALRITGAAKTPGLLNALETYVLSGN